MTTTPDTTGYMLLGFGVILGMLLVYVASLRLRWRNLEEDQKVLNSLPPPEL
jgi:hypothetical protein